MATRAAAETRLITETPASAPASRLHVQPEWAEAMPWLIQGTTDRSADMSLFGRTPAGEVMDRWLRLRDDLGCRSVVHARQVHGADLLVHGDMPAGVLLAGDGDGHLTRHAGLLLTISVADCVPIFLAAPDVRAVALLHGGWRGVAAGILEKGVDALARRFNASPAQLRVHFGPAICGACFEVGPEVPAGLGLSLRPEGKAYVDLRSVLQDRAIRCGVTEAHISRSSHCTRCGDAPFFSHRGGCRERQLGVLGIRSGVA